MIQMHWQDKFMLISLVLIKLVLHLRVFFLIVVENFLHTHTLIHIIYLFINVQFLNKQNIFAYVNKQTQTVYIKNNTRTFAVYPRPGVAREDLSERSALFTWRSPFTHHILVCSFFIIQAVWMFTDFFVHTARSKLLLRLFDQEHIFRPPGHAWPVICICHCCHDAKTPQTEIV